MCLSCVGCRNLSPVGEVSKSMIEEFKILHMFSGLGGAALGFQQACAEWRGIRGRFHTLGGIDCDAETCEDFQNLTGAPAIRMDIFERRDFVAYHGKEPPPGWREVTPYDLREAVRETPDVIFLSPPCKGFSSLLPQKTAASEKYQALNRLVTRGLFLAMEAWRDNLPAIILFENVPRITSRGKNLLHTVKGLLTSYGYVVAEGFHDCGELGGLAQHRRRYLKELPKNVTREIRQEYLNDDMFKVESIDIGESLSTKVDELRGAQCKLGFHRQSGYWY